MKRLVLGLMVLLAAVASGAASDEEGQQRVVGGLAFSDQYELTIVNVIAHVTDKKGNVVTDLTKADFRILQDGQEKQISNFQLYTEQELERSAEIPSVLPPAVIEAEPALEQQAVSLILYIDNENLNPMHRNRVLGEMRGFVLANVRPPVQMMVVSFQKDLKILQPFTSDRGEILEALREIRTHSGGWLQRESTRQDVLNRMWEESERQGQVSGSGARRTQSYGDVLNYADEEAYNLALSMEALREVVTFLVGLPGRKSVLYISNGLPMVPGMDLFNAYADSIRDPTVLTEIQRYDRSSSFKSMIDAANTQGVSFYTIGAGGLEVPGMSSSAYRSARGPVPSTTRADTFTEGLRFLANGTGGLAFVKTNDFEDGFRQIQKDLHTYYSLGYRLVPSGSDKVHRIEVTIPDRPELVVRSRRRFIEKSLQTRVQERVLANLVQDLDENPMDLSFEAGAPTLASADRWTVPIHVSFPIGKVALLPEGEEHVGRVVLFVAARDADGNRSETVREEYELRIPTDGYEQALDTRFGIGTSLIMEAGSYRVAVALMDEVTSQASYKTVNATISLR